jgi:hypothetical protein
MPTLSALSLSPSFSLSPINRVRTIEIRLYLIYMVRTPSASVRETDREIKREREKEGGREIKRKREGQREIKREREGQREIKREREGDKEREGGDKEIERKREGDKERERDV